VWFGRSLVRPRRCSFRCCRHARARGGARAGPAGDHGRDRRRHGGLSRLWGARDRPRPPATPRCRRAVFRRSGRSALAQAGLAVRRACLSGRHILRDTRVDSGPGGVDVTGGVVGDRRAQSRRHHRLGAGPASGRGLAHPVERGPSGGDEPDGPARALGRGPHPRRGRAHLEAESPRHGPSDHGDGRSDPRRARPAACPSARRRPGPVRHGLRGLAA